MKHIVAPCLRALPLLTSALAANSAFAAIAIPDVASIDWTRTGLLAGSIALLAIVIALTMSGRRNAGPQDDAHLRRIGNMTAEPTESREAPRGGSDEAFDPRRRIEGKLPGLPV